MTIWDKVKSISEEVKSKAKEVTSGEEATDIAKTVEETNVVSQTKGPSATVKNALSIAASTFIKSSKKIVDSIVGKYRPDLSIHDIIDEATIRSIIEDKRSNKKVEPVILAEIACNNVETIPIAESIGADIKEALEAEIRKCQKRLKEESAPSDSTKKRLRAANKAFDEYENSELAIKLKIISLIAGDAPANYDKIESLLGKLDTEHPDWENVIILKHVLTHHADQLQEDKLDAYLHKALSINPLDKQLLDMLKQRCKDDEGIIVEQVASIIDS